MHQALNNSRHLTVLPVHKPVPQQQQEHNDDKQYHDSDGDDKPFLAFRNIALRVYHLLDLRRQVVQRACRKGVGQSSYLFIAIGRFLILSHIIIDVTHVVHDALHVAPNGITVLADNLHSTTEELQSLIIHLTTL